MIEELKELVQGTGLVKAITDIENELNQGKLVEKEVEAVSLRSKDEQAFDVLVDERDVQFKKSRKTKFTGYEPYTEEESEALIARSLITGVHDALHLADALSGLCEDFDIEIYFDDEKKITKEDLDRRPTEIESALREYEQENDF